MSTTNFPNGVTNAALGGPLSTFVAPDPTKVFSFVDDFNVNFTISTATTAAALWVSTTNGTGAAISVGTASGRANGLVTLTTDTVTANLAYMQYKMGQALATGLPTWQLETGKPTWVKARFKLSVATAAANSYIGIMENGVADFSAITGGFMFKVTTGALTFNLLKNSTNTAISMGSPLANDTFVEVGAYYNGNDRVDTYVNNNRVAGTTTLTNLPTSLLTQSIGIGNTGTNAAAPVLTVDYLFIAKARETEIA